MSTAPLVTVCVATYNRRPLLERTLETLKGQTLTDYELIVCDDASTDGTAEYLSSLGWPRLRVLRNERNLNLPGAMARLFSEARGRYIGMQHDHDLYEPDFLVKMVSLLERHPSAGFGCCAYRIIDDEGRLLAESDISEFRLFPSSGLLPGKKLVEVLATRVHTPIPAMGTMFRREAVERAGGYRSEWHLAADEDLYRRVAGIADVAFCPERLFRMRMRPAERMHVMGGCRSLFLLYKFHRDTSDRCFADRQLLRYFNRAFLRFRLRGALLRESLSLWLWADGEHLSAAMEHETVRDGRRVLNPLERALFRLWFCLLASSTPCGGAVGGLRRSLRDRRREK